MSARLEQGCLLRCRRILIFLKAQFSFLEEVYKQSWHGLGFQEWRLLIPKALLKQLLGVVIAYSMLKMDFCWGQGRLNSSWLKVKRLTFVEGYLILLEPRPELTLEVPVSLVQALALQGLKT